MSDIIIKDLTKRYGSLVALDHLSLNVKSGEMIALLGINGAGKTTAIKLLSCLSTPDEGDALLGGYSIRTNAVDVKRIINVSPQETAIARKLSVRENLTLIAELHGMENVSARVDTVLAELGLSDVAQKRAETLSGGWQRRVSIAMALISEPKILFLDEPTLGLDVIARAELWAHIRALKGKMTVVLTTHYLEEVEALCDRVAILASGSLRACGTVDELKQLADTDNFEKAFITLSTGGAHA